METIITEQIMTTTQVAHRFNELAQQEKWFEIQEQFFSADVKSIDPENSPWFGYAEGKTAVRKKGETFVQKIDVVHSASTTEPVVAGNHFAVTLELDATYKGMGRQSMKEVCVYEVKDGKIVKEEFFYLAAVCVSVYQLISFSYQNK